MAKFFYIYIGKTTYHAVHINIGLEIIFLVPSQARGQPSIPGFPLDTVMAD